MSKDDQNDADVWDRAQRSLEEGASHPAETDALKARLSAYIAERHALEVQGTVPRGVRRRGERLLEEVSALKARPERVAATSERADEDPKAQKPRKPSRSPRSDTPPFLGDAPSGKKGHPSRSRGRSERGGER